MIFLQQIITKFYLNKLLYFINIINNLRLVVMRKLKPWKAQIKNGTNGYKLTKVQLNCIKVLALNIE